MRQLVVIGNTDKDFQLAPERNFVKCQGLTPAFRGRVLILSEASRVTDIVSQEFAHPPSDVEVIPVVNL